MIPDEEVKKIINATGTRNGVVLTFCDGTTILLQRYVAFRFSMFLDRALLDSCALSGKKLDEGFAR
jgi:hypothetical protein